MDNFKKVFLAGVGALSLSKEKAQKVVEELIAQGQVKEVEGRKLVDDMLKKADQTRKEVEKNVKSHVDTALSKVNLVTQAELRKMEKRIHNLEQHLANKSKAASTVEKTTKNKTVKKTTKKTKK